LVAALVTGIYLILIATGIFYLLHIVNALSGELSSIVKFINNVKPLGNMLAYIDKMR
jgi:hypothetical protein